jgi:hypothetical protein
MFRQYKDLENILGLKNPHPFGHCGNVKDLWIIMVKTSNKLEIQDTNLLTVLSRHFEVWLSLWNSTSKYDQNDKMLLSRTFIWHVSVHDLRTRFKKCTYHGDEVQLSSTFQKIRRISSASIHRSRCFQTSATSATMIQHDGSHIFLDEDDWDGFPLCLICFMRQRQARARLRRRFMSSAEI